MSWREGRQGTGYGKWTLIASSLFDMHILRYLPGQYIPPHTDKLPDGKRHFRINIRLCGEDSFQCSNVVFRKWRVTVFRPDLYEHSVPPVSKIRLLLSIGFALKEKSDGKA